MTQAITRTQEEKLEHIRALIKKYSDHLENVTKLVESGIQFMDEPEMAVFLQVNLFSTKETNPKCGCWKLLITFLLFYIYFIFKIWFTD
jgi:hypothetical protein